jgi:hypothetical protein
VLFLSVGWSGLVRSGLVWSGLVWSGLVWSGLVWSGLVGCAVLWDVYYEAKWLQDSVVDGYMHEISVTGKIHTRYK